MKSLARVTTTKTSQLLLLLSEHGDRKKSLHDCTRQIEKELGERRVQANPHPPGDRRFLPIPAPVPPFFAHRFAAAAAAAHGKTPPLFRARSASRTACWPRDTYGKEKKEKNLPNPTRQNDEATATTTPTGTPRGRNDAAPEQIFMRSSSSTRRADDGDVGEG